MLGSLNETQQSPAYGGGHGMKATPLEKYGILNIWQRGRSNRM